MHNQFSHPCTGEGRPRGGKVLRLQIVKQLFKLSSLILHFNSVFTLRQTKNMPPKKNSQTPASTSRAQTSKGKARILRDETSSEDNGSDEDYVQEGTESRGRQRPENKRPRNVQTPVLSKFVNEKAQMKFCEFAIRLIHIERAFNITKKPYVDTIAFYNWQGLTTAPELCNVAIAKEYYANGAGADPNEVETKGVYLRGKYLKLTSKSVNDYYGLKSYAKDDLSDLCEVGNPDTVFKMLSLPGTDWERNDDGEIKHARLRDLTAEAKTWLLFINSRLMPTSQNSKISVDKLFLVYAIKNKLTVDVGKFFITYMNHAMTDDCQSMYFPLFLMEQAIELGIKVSGECLPPIGPIKDSQLNLYQTAEVADRRRLQQEEEERARGREELARAANDIEVDEAQQEQDQHINNPQPAQGVHNFHNMQQVLEGLQTSFQNQNEALTNHMDRIEGRWTGLQDCVGVIGTRLDSMMQEQTTKWNALDNKIDQCQMQVHHLNLRMIHHHQSRAPDTYFPPIEELDNQARMIVDTSSTRVVMQQGRNPNVGSSSHGFRTAHASFQGFSQFSNQPPAN